MNQLPNRLKSARKMFGVSLQEITNKLGNHVSRQTIHKYEQGTITPDSNYLNNFCYTLGIKPDYFYKEIVELGQINFRKLDKLSSTDQQMTIEKSKDLLTRYLELESLVFINSRFENPLSNNKISSFDDAESAAKELRKKWNLGTDPLPSIVELLEENEIKVLFINTAESFDGMSTFTSNEEIPIVVLNQNKGVVRKRFTASHELGHLVFKNRLSVDEKTEEKYCNTFAAAFLMPKEKLIYELGNKRRELNLKELIQIENRYGISVQSLLYRAKEADIISQYYFEHFTKHINMVYGRKAQFGNFPDIEQPTRFNQLLLRGLSEEAFSESKAAELSNMKVSTFREFLQVKQTEI